MAAFRYDDSPQRLDTFVSVDEVDGLLADEGKQLAKDNRRTTHFLQRTRSTLLAVRAQIQALHKDVQLAQIRATSLGTPTTLDPRSAAKYLPPEELAQLGDALLKEKFEAMQKIEADLKADRAATLRQSASLKFAVATILEDLMLPESVRHKVAAAFEGRLPEDTAASSEQAPQEPRPALAPRAGDEPLHDPTGSLDDLFN
jgi:hypothetical protein